MGPGPQELSLAEREALAERDGEDCLLRLGWAYLRRQLRRALASGEPGALSPLAGEQVLELLAGRPRQELPSESPPLQLKDVDWLDEQTVVFSVLEAESLLARALFDGGQGLSASVALARGVEWRLLALAPGTGADPDLRRLEGLFAAAPQPLSGPDRTG